MDTIDSTSVEPGADSNPFEPTAATNEAIREDSSAVINEASSEALNENMLATTLPEMAAESAVEAEPLLGTMEQLIDLLKIGGPVVWVLCAFSVFALALILMKSWQLTFATLGARRLCAQALKLWQQGDADAAAALLRNSKKPVPRLVLFAMTGFSQPNHHQELIREELGRIAANEMENLRSYLRPLEVIATVSPLLGLLGTVIGMILAFQQMQLAGNQVDPSVLSGGIWQALLTTAAGLCVALPVVLAHSTLERKTERVAHQMEDLVTAVFTAQINIEPKTNMRPSTERDATGRDSAGHDTTTAENWEATGKGAAHAA
ncbi:MotA/TolQ/ExbB proton channel family protein [Nitrincola alkalilacustris]|uniref:MotA/TolQ/ExbB proton channel family protein n=1 Tax=Nitrincola alkalilacustris TaxID=1571224 RepID=UPI001F0ECFB5|nr:MotA/TolQ/ExbB proton channel family protein [Nitrincola alkalilacustris]